MWFFARVIEGGLQEGEEVECPSRAPRAAGDTGVQQGRNWGWEGSASPPALLQEGFAAWAR